LGVYCRGNPWNLDRNAGYSVMSFTTVIVGRQSARVQPPDVPEPPPPTIYQGQVGPYLVRIEHGAVFVWIDGKLYEQT
jgi:hypothetical protein